VRRWGPLASVVVAVGVVCAAAVVLASEGTPARSHRNVHDIVVRDFAISAPSRIAAGDVVEFTMKDPMITS
jgi:hypothetical protein